MASLDAFLPLIRGRLPACPDFILRDAIRDACIAFCKRTRLLEEDVSLALTAGNATAALYPLGGQAWEVVRVRRGTQVLRQGSAAVFRELGLDTQSGTPSAYYLDGALNLVFGPVPDADETLTATVTVRPDDTATEVDEVLWTDYREPLVAGARAWVRRNYGEWINPQAEAEDRLIFEQAVHNQNVRRTRGGVGYPLRVQAHAF